MMIMEAMRLSMLDQEEEQRKAAEEKKKKSGGGSTPNNASGEGSSVSRFLNVFMQLRLKFPL